MRATAFNQPQVLSTAVQAVRAGPTSGREHSQHWRPTLGGKSEHQKEK